MRSMATLTPMSTRNEGLFPTGVPNVDINIMLSIPDLELQSIYQNNGYMTKLYNSNEFWRLKMERVF